MLDLLTDPQVILSFLTLAVPEIVLGIDNLLFVQIIAGRVAPGRRDTARRVGLALALVTRLILLAAISWVADLSFLLLAGVALIADGLHFHIPKGYLYFAIAFSALVEGLNILAKSRRRCRRAMSNVAPS